MLLGGGFFVFVDRTPLEDCTMWHFIVSTSCEKYFDTFEYVRPGHISKFALFIALSHVDLTGNPYATFIYLTSASTLGRSYAMYAERVVFLISGVWCSSISLFGLR